MIKFGDTTVRFAGLFGLSYRFSGMLLLFFLGNVHAQGSLSGKVTDAETGEPILFGDVIIYENDVLVTGTQTDFDGNYEISQIDTGRYKVVFKYVGYREGREEVYIEENKETNLNAKIGTSFVLEHHGCGYGHYPPLGGADDFEKGDTFTAKDIRRMPNKN